MQEKLYCKCLISLKRCSAQYVEQQKQRKSSDFSDMSASRGGAVPSAAVKHPCSPEFCSTSSPFLRDLTCFKAEKKKARGQIIAVRTAAPAFGLPKAFIGCHKLTRTKQSIHNKPGHTSSLILRCWADDMPRVNINLTFHTSRKTMAKSGMKSKERRLRSTTSLRALGSWSVGERNQSVWSWTDSRSNNNQHFCALHKKKPQSASKD